MSKLAMTTVSHVTNRNLWDGFDFILGDARGEDGAVSIKQQIEANGLTVEYRNEKTHRIIMVTGSDGDRLEFTTWTEPRVQEANRKVYEIEEIAGYFMNGRLHDLKYSLSYTSEEFCDTVENILEINLSGSRYYRNS